MCIRTRGIAVPKPFLLPQEADLDSLSHFQSYTLRLAALRFSKLASLPVYPSHLHLESLTMKFFATVSLLAGLGAALPTALEVIPTEEGIQARQTSSSTRNELQTGGTCPPVIFIFARGSTESGNLVYMHP